jgi:membrane protein DedA with SNARE-associated domain
MVARHGELLLFLYVLADQLNVPVPAAPVLMAAGGLAAAGRLSLPGAIGLGVLATLAADLIQRGERQTRGAVTAGELCSAAPT